MKLLFFFNMGFTKTIAKKGARQVIIQTQNQEKCRCSVLLGITADGDRLPPLVIFKAKENKTVYKKLQSNINVKNHLIYVECNNNAWCTESIMKKWFDNIWIPYINKNKYAIDGYGYFIMDKATAHWTEEILTNYKTDKSFISFIPAGLTRYFQPLDVSVNKPFKTALKQKYINYCIEEGQENQKVSRNKIIEFICNVWYDNSIISKEIIYNSFRCTGIANNINGTEDYLFSAWNYMKNEKPLIINDFNLIEGKDVEDDSDDESENN